MLRRLMRRRYREGYDDGAAGRPRSPARFGDDFQRWAYDAGWTDGARAMDTLAAVVNARRGPPRAPIPPYYADAPRGRP